MPANIDDLLNRLTTEGARHHDDTYDYRLTMVPVGEVTLPTGRIVACDPWAAGRGCEPFTTAVPPGRYPLRAWVTVVHSGGPRCSTAPWGGVEKDRRTAALQLVIRDEPAVRWEAAPGGAAEIDEDGFRVYPSDSGIGTLADECAVRALSHWSYEQLEDVYDNGHSPPAPAAAVAVTDPASGANVVAVTTGWGDGDYATFVGRSADGAVTSFVTDFRVV